MPTHVALLRAVNLPSHNKVSMGGLRDWLSDLGMKNPRTLLQSGNLVFGDARAPGQLERVLEREAKARLHLDTDVFVRSAGEWDELVDANPFAAEARRIPNHVVVIALKDAPERAAVSALQQAITGREVVRASGRHAYFVYPDGIGRSRVTMALIERKLGTRGTARNWNTVMKLHAMVVDP